MIFAGILLIAWHLVYFTSLDGSTVAINPSSVVAVYPAPVGYRKGTMIATGNGNFIVRESEADVNKKIECECQSRETK